MRVVNKMPQFQRSAESVLGDALREGARDLLNNAKDKAPLKDGLLRGRTEITKQGNLSMRVQFKMDYALYQEIGRGMRHYTTSGTGPRYLLNAAKMIEKKMPSIFKKHGLRARVW
jgi:hypothetical protein